MSPKTVLRALEKSQLQRGKWYWGFDCKVCGARFAVGQDESNGTRPISVSTPAPTFWCPCPFCGADFFSYSILEIKQFESAP